MKEYNITMTYIVLVILRLQTAMPTSLFFAWKDIKLNIGRWRNEMKWMNMCVHEHTTKLITLRYNVTIVTILLPDIIVIWGQIVVSSCWIVKYQKYATYYERMKYW